MPTNLPPEYFEVEERYKAAQTPEEKITLLEELISTIPKHKGTDHLRADFRRRLSKLRESSQAKKGSGTAKSEYHIDREGAGQVVVLGAANVGKSALVRALTNAEPEVNDAPFSTWSPMPGMMVYQNVPVQLIDTPPLEGDYVDPELFNLIRRSDLVMLVVDLQTHPIRQLKGSVARLVEKKIAPDHQRDKYSDRRMVYKPFLVVANKCDDADCDEVFELFREFLEEDWPLLPVSILEERNLDKLGAEIVEKLKVIRVYTQAPGEQPDLERPFVLKQGSTVSELAGRIHKDFREQLKAARVWGSTAFPGQMVARDYVLQDGDVVEFRI